MRRLSEHDRSVVESLVGDEIHIDTSGTFYYEPGRWTERLSSATLRMIADHLDDLNHIVENQNDLSID